MDIANPIAAARKTRGFSQSDLAEAVGVTRGAVAQWEMKKGTRPDPAFAIRIADLLGITLDEIYGRRAA